MADWIPLSQARATMTTVTAAPSPATAGPDAGMAVCVESGKVYPKSEMIEYNGQWISAQYKDQFFQKLREGVQPTLGHIRYAGFWIRAVAFLLDSLIMGVATIVIVLPLIFLFPGALTEEDFVTTLFIQGISNLIFIGIWILYFWLFIGAFAATPGKMALSLKVVRADGGKIGYPLALGRSASKWLSCTIMYIGCIIAAFDDQKRAMHDYMCGTRVIYKG